jgi:peptidoglycan/LPS O-acetylase OafA/YrhL
MRIHWLFHWLIFSVIRFIDGMIPIRFFIPLFALTFLLVIPTYYFIEQPFQRFKSRATIVFSAFFVTNGLVLCLLFLLTGIESLGIPPVSTILKGSIPYA